MNTKAITLLKEEITYLENQIEISYSKESAENVHRKALDMVELDLYDQRQSWEEEIEQICETVNILEGLDKDHLVLYIKEQNEEGE